jgi:PAS domain S-box-containing protein
MRHALSGKSGVLTGLDYRGAEVLAAYEPVSILDLGLVAKIDTSEIRRPFIRAGLIAISVAMLVIFIASRLFFRISRPIEQAIDQQAETFLILAETLREGIIIASTTGVIQFINPAIEKLFGYTRRELIGESVKRLMPREHSLAHDDYMKNYMQTGEAKIIGIGRQLTAMRKDGTRFPIYLSIGDIKTSDARLFAGVIVDISEQQQLQREILEIPVSEQRRIGQELHDGLGQQLTGLGLLATSLLNKASKPEHELAAKLAKGLQEAISQVRALSRGLMPVDVDAEGLINSIENLVAEIRSHSDVSILLTINDRVRVSDNSSALHLFRIVQEALNNAIKHARADQIRVSVGIEGSRGCFTIRDNGAGFQHAPDKSAGLGLRIMQHRCGLIDAEFKIESSHGEGTAIKCYFPVE